jgi:hypothetical protein
LVAGSCDAESKGEEGAGLPKTVGLVRDSVVRAPKVGESQLAIRCSMKIFLLTCLPATSTFAPGSHSRQWERIVVSFAAKQSAAFA